MGTPSEKERELNSIAKLMIRKLDDAYHDCAFGARLDSDYSQHRTKMIFVAERAHAGVLCCGQEDDALNAIESAGKFLQAHGVE